MESIGRFFGLHSHQRSTGSGSVLGVNLDDPYNEPAPLAACSTGDLDCLDREIQKDNSIVYRDYRSGKSGTMVSLLVVATDQGHIDLAQRLIDKRADVNQATEEGGTPLYFAAQEGKKEIIELLLANGADPQKKFKILSLGRFPLLTKSPLAAAQYNGGNKESVKMIKTAVKNRRIDPSSDSASLLADKYPSYGSIR